MSDVTVESNRVRRSYELPQNEYQLIQRVQERLGCYAGCVVECILTRQIKGFGKDVTPGEEKLIREFAHALNVELPT